LYTKEFLPCKGYVMLLTDDLNERKYAPMYASLRKLLFQMNPETAHDWAIFGLKMIQASPTLINWIAKSMILQDSRLQTQLWSLTFPNPIGLAAGFDKHANVYPALAALGFGFVEVGTLTPRPQLGNPTPRLFRLPAEEGLINRMGFNNHGVKAAKRTFARLTRPSIPIGINLGKNKETPNKEAANDYRQGLETLYGHGDYFVINISSPNTERLRDLQNRDALPGLLRAILSKRKELTKKKGAQRPILLKVSPDLSQEQLTDVVNTALSAGIDGIIATNTTLSRKGLQSPHQQERGGVSGKPLTQRSTMLIRHIYSITQGKVPIIGVGGVFTGRDAYEKIRAGANLIQIYTSLIYRGPSVAKSIQQELLRWMERDHLSSIQEAVGLDSFYGRYR
jgi:dihydroorotate dehydrogenase